MAKIFALTEAETLLLREMARDFRSRKTNKPIAEAAEWGKTYGEDSQSPEVFIAKLTEISGISGMSADIVDSKECEIYRLVTESGITSLKGTGKLVSVYNFSTDGVSPGYLLIIRTKFGSWVPVISVANVGIGRVTQDIWPGTSGSFFPTISDGSSYGEECLGTWRNTTSIYPILDTQLVRWVRLIDGTYDIHPIGCTGPNTETGTDVI